MDINATPRAIHKLKQDTKAKWDNIKAYKDKDIDTVTI